MNKRLTPQDFDHAFRYFRRTAFRLEVQAVYRVEAEREAFADFLRGESHAATDYDYYAEWLDQVQTMAQAGRHLQRVRVLEFPEPSTYQRFELALAPYNIAAGESLRTISRPSAVKVGIPVDRDWWIFDDETIAVMDFTPDGVPQGGVINTDRETVSQYCLWRDLAVRHSAPFTERKAA